MLNQSHFLNTYRVTEHVIHLLTLDFILTSGLSGQMQDGEQYSWVDLFNGMP